MQLTLPGEFTWGEEGEDFLNKLPPAQQQRVRERAVAHRITPAEAYSIITLEDLQEDAEDRARPYRRN